MSRSPSFYRGEQYDPDLSLYYLRARYYNPSTGRFMSRDPEDHSLRNPNALHRYLYANGEPVNRIDPSGRSATLQFVFTTAEISAPAEAGLTALVGGTGASIDAAMTLLETGISEILEDLAAAATEQGLAAWESIVQAVDDFDAIMAEKSIIGGIVQNFACAELGIIASEVVQTASGKSWLGETVGLVEATGCGIALTIGF
jgi:RHS repeat-associated protein